MVVQRIHTYCAMCVSRCGVVATVSDGVLTKVTPDPAHPNGGICVKGTAAPEIVYAPDRLRYPMARTRPKGDPDPGWARISWDEALALTASRLLEIKPGTGPRWWYSRSPPRRAARPTCTRPSSPGSPTRCGPWSRSAPTPSSPTPTRCSAGRRCRRSASTSTSTCSPNPSGALADLLLPAASCWESQAVLPCPPPYALAGHTGTWAQFRPAVVPPVHQARPDLEIIFDLAERLGLGEEFFGGDIEKAFDHQLAPSGLTVSQLRDHPAGVRAPGQTRYRKYADTDPATGQPRGFQTPTGKLEIYSTSFARAGFPPLPEVWDPTADPGRPGADEDYPLTLTFARLVQYCDDGHRNVPRLRRQAPEPFLEIHPATATASGIEDGDWVLLETSTGAVTVKAKLSASLHPMVVATQYGWWQECQQLAAPGHDPFSPEGANVNLLIPDDVTDPISGSVAHRSQRCRVRKRADPATTPS